MTRDVVRTPGARSARRSLRGAALLLLAALALPLLLLLSGPASATSTPTLPDVPAAPAPAGADGATAQPTTPERTGPGPEGPGGPRGTSTGDGSSVTLDFGDLAQPSSSVTVILGLTLVSLLPAILLTCTSFTKVLIVLGLTRNALGLQQTPNNQVLAGLALFLSLFIMGPVLSDMNEVGLQPYLDQQKTASLAIEDGIQPLRGFMLDHTDDDELTLLTSVAGRDLPESASDVGMTTLIPAFVLTELKQAFIIGFIVFIPFLVIDIVVSGALMALGMMMMPPVMVSLPFKLLLFVMVDGWALVIRSLVASYG